MDPLPQFPHQKKYYSFYSTYFNLLTTDPAHMLVPIDDHGFHRGDGVFEAVKWRHQKIWLLDKHLERLYKSAENIFLKIPLSLSELETKVKEVVKLANRERGIIRIFATRGPGNFGVSPKDTIGAQVYIVTTELKEVATETLATGARVCWSQIPAKIDLFAQTKSLNYLPNVLMKRECEGKNVDYAIGINPQGVVTESYTENIFFLHGPKLIYPQFHNTLKGTTLSRLLELIQYQQKLQPNFPIQSIEAADITPEQAVGYENLFFAGTTIDLLWAQSLENKKYSRPPLFDLLRELLLTDQGVRDL